MIGLQNALCVRYFCMCNIYMFRQFERCQTVSADNKRKERDTKKTTENNELNVCSFVLSLDCSLTHRFALFSSSLYFWCVFFFHGKILRQKKTMANVPSFVDIKHFNFNAQTVCNECNAKQPCLNERCGFSVDLIVWRF